MTKAMLIDLTRCIGCRGCQAACKQWHDLPGETTHNTGQLPEPALDQRQDAHHGHLQRGGAGRPVRLGLRQAPVYALRASRLRVGLHRGRAAQDGRWAGGLRRQQVHRLSLLPVRLPLRRAGLRVGRGAGADRQVRLLRRPPGRGHGAGLRQGLSYRGDHLRRARRAAGRGAPPHRRRSDAATSTTSTASARWAARRCSTCPACPLPRWASPLWAISPCRPTPRR